ncbi:MAG: class A beta-lactamase-related serine hydrolase [Acidobacteriia bacterium]|nr:class A beta-lactamase-related serine hydrolase [Terriglobia bacterium]
MAKPARRTAIVLLAALSSAPWVRAQSPTVPASPPAGQPTPAAAAVGAGEFGQLEGLIPDLMAKGGVPGLAIAVMKDGAVAWSRPFGVTDVGSGSPVTPETVFEAASLGKPVFAYAVVRLAERGDFDLDRPLPVYLPYADVRNDPRIRKITARRVLCHTTGFPNWRRGGQLTIDFDPGDRFSYSGEGYVYLQKVIEAVTGMSVDDFVGREVFQPLGMAASSYGWRDAYEASAAVGHDYLQQPTRKAKPTKPNVAATLHTTVGDYARFLAEMFHPRLLKSVTVEQMLKAQVELEKDLSWGLGWGLERASGRSYFWHWGDNGAFRGFAIGCRETGDGLVLLTNAENGLSIAEPIVGAVIGGSHPVFGWLDVDRYDSPARTIRERIVRAGVANGDRSVLRTLDELEKTYPRVAFTEKLLNRIGYELLEKKQVAAGIAVFEYNARLYPKAWNVYDSLAEAYAAGGDLRLAVQYYEKSLKLNPDNENARVALRQIREAKEH